MSPNPVQKRNDDSQQTHAEVRERDIIMTRVFDATPDVIWRAWTDPKILAEWWGPAGFTTTTKVMDVRPGGTWEHTMHGPDGTDYPNKKVYKVVDKPKRLRYSHGGGEEGGKDTVSFDVTVNFEAVGNKTKVTMTMAMPTAEQLQHVIKTYGAVEGGKQTMARLAEFLQKRTMQPLKEVNFDRVYDAPIAQVWKAWTDPAMLKQWWGPHGVTIPECEVDLRVGGKFHIVMEAGEAMGPYKGTKWPMLARFTVVEPNARITYDGKAWTEGKNDNEETQIDQVTDIVFSEEVGKTRIKLRAAVNKVGPGAKMAIEGMQYGFTQQLEKLNDFLAKND
jgi:uncharacterized protein YndB with AHSA1/START domain